MTRAAVISALLEQLSPPQADELRRVVAGDESVSGATRGYWNGVINRWIEESEGEDL